MIRPTQVEARGGYQIWLRYSDGVEGVVDLSAFAGRGVFEIWADPACFEAVHISEHGSVAWTDEVELCADSLYLQVTGKKPDSLFEVGLTTAIYA